MKLLDVIENLKDILDEHGNIETGLDNENEDGFIEFDPDICFTVIYGRLTIV